ncbi:MAG: YheT family hydrolase [Saprospiraceae bacterium]
MPVLKKSTYPGPPRYQFNAHLQTILPALFRKVNVPFERERLTLSDGDFVDLDWLDKGSRKLVILTHGLEGNTNRHYMKGMAEAFAKKGWDSLAWNCRSCSGEMNKKLRLYHHGEINDLEEVINHALHTKDYEQIVLIGFSMGGNINMKYLGVHADHLPAPIYKAVSISAPCDLHTSVKKLDEPVCRFYKKRFLKKLEPKIKFKSQQYPDKIDYSLYKTIKNWRDFDQFYTINLNGFKSPDEFYTQGSAINFLDKLRIPTLLINALNDPILTPECFPKSIAEKNPNLILEMPTTGGHVGFAMRSRKGAWTEERALEFILGH